MRRIGLVGCVKTKVSTPAAARDLYVSPMFVGRRRYVEASCDDWRVLSAKHGLVHPKEVLAPYDETLVGKPVALKRAWAARVLQQILNDFGESLDDYVFELHAGADYRRFDLETGLLTRGAQLENPTEGLGLGEQLAFYASRNRAR